VSTLSKAIFLLAEHEITHTASRCLQQVFNLFLKQRGIHGDNILQRGVHLHNTTQGEFSFECTRAMEGSSSKQQMFVSDSYLCKNHDITVTRKLKTTNTKPWKWL